MNRGIAVANGVNYEMRIVQVHITFQFYTTECPNPLSWLRTVYNVVNGVVYFDNAVVFGYSVG